MNLNDLTPQQRAYAISSGIDSVRNGDIYDDISDVVATDDSIGNGLARG